MLWNYIRQEYVMVINYKCIGKMENVLKNGIGLSSVTAISDIRMYKNFTCKYEFYLYMETTISRVSWHVVCWQL